MSKTISNLFMNKIIFKKIVCTQPLATFRIITRCHVCKGEVREYIPLVNFFSQKFYIIKIQNVKQK